MFFQYFLLSLCLLNTAASGSEPSSPRVSRRETTTTIVKKETVTEIQRREEIQKMILERKKDEMKEYEGNGKYV